MLQRQIVYILTFFDVWCYGTGFSILSNSRSGKFVVIFVHILIAMSFTLYEFRLIFELFALIGILNTINEAIQYTAALFTYWLIILDSFVYRRQHKKFWTILEYIDDHFSSQYIDLKNYLWRFMEYVSLSTILYVLLIISNAFPKSNSVFAFIFLIIIWQIRMFYYILCLEIVLYQLKTIESEVLMMKRMYQLDISRASRFYLFESKRMKWIQEYYYCISTMIELLNTFFSWSQAATILLCFYSFVTNLNWLYASIDEFSVTQIICKYSKMLLKFQFDRILMYSSSINLDRTFKYCNILFVSCS